MPWRRGMRLPFVWLVLSAGFGLASLATAAEPDEASLTRLRGTLARASAVRLTTPFGVSIERKVEVEPAGLRITGSGEMGVVVLSPEPVMHVEWARVQRLEVKRGIGRNILLPAAAIGAMIGGAIGYSGLDEGTLGGTGGKPFFLLVGAATGIALGSVIGSGYDPWVAVEVPRTSAPGE